MSDVTRTALERVAAVLTAEGGLLADALLPGGPAVPDGDPALGALAASGPAAPGEEGLAALVVEAVHEAHLLHGGTSRLLDAGDRDLAILAGDRLYALGLAELARVGAIAAVRELADVIALCAQARAHADDDLAAAAWEAGATAVGWGTCDALEAAKNAARAGDSHAGAALRDAAERRRDAAVPARS